MNPATPAPSNSLSRLIAWVAVIGTTLPEIIWQESGHQIGCWFTTIESLLVLVAGLLAIWIPSLRPLTRFLVAVALLNLAWSCISPVLAELPAVRAVTDNASWGARLFLARTFTLTGAILVSLTLIGSGITRRDLFLCKGNPTAPAQPFGVSWMRLGPAFMLVFGLVLSGYLYLTVHPNFSVSERIIRTFPWSIAVATLNAASEEFQFRSVLLAHLRGIFCPAETVLLTAVFFGLGHYYGQPSGPLGVLVAGFAGWIWARSMIETRGGVWAFLIHFVQDIVIFTFLAVG